MSRQEKSLIFLELLGYGDLSKMLQQLDSDLSVGCFFRAEVFIAPSGYGTNWNAFEYLAGLVTFF